MQLTSSVGHGVIFCEVLLERGREDGLLVLGDLTSLPVAFLWGPHNARDDLRGRMCARQHSNLAIQYIWRA